jgi:mannose-1-phosphate guanylyltransferase
MSLVPSKTNFSFEHQLFPSLLERGEPVYAYHSSCYWIDIGTPQKYMQLHQDLLSGRSDQYHFSSDEHIVIGENSHVHPTARIAGPSVIGSDCTIGQRAQIIGPVVIGPGCQISDEAIIGESIVWQSVTIEPGARVKNSIIAGNCRLGTGSTVEESVLGDGVTVASDYKLEPGSQIWPGQPVG